MSHAPIRNGERQSAAVNQQNASKQVYQRTRLERI